MVIDIVKLTEKSKVSFVFEENINLNKSLNLQCHVVNGCFFGDITKLGDIYTCSGTASVVTPFLCDFCLTLVSMPISFYVNEVFKKQHNLSHESDDLIVWLTSTKINVSALFFTNLYAHMPMQVICNNNCKGLCTRCGTNLNVFSCECTKKEESNNSHFEVLKSIKFK